jgi:hypothetical protein
MTTVRSSLNRFDAWWFRWGGPAIMAGLALILLASFTVRALSHSFYPWECCHDQDCWPMGAGADAKEPEPVVTPAGWRLHDGAVVAFAATRPSPDGRFYVCRQQGASTGAVIRPEGRPVCLFVPQQNF